MDRSYRITTNGVAVIAACLAGEKPLTLTRAAIGSGKVPEGQDLREVHALVSRVADATIGERTRVGNAFHVSVQYANSAHPEQEAFSIAEFMLYASDPETGGETDFAYGTLGDFAQPVPKYDPAAPECVFTFPLILAVSPDLQIQVTASPGVVTYADLEAMMEAGYVGSVKAEITVPAETWTRDEAPEIPGCSYHADVHFAGLTGEEAVTVAFHDLQKARGAAGAVKTLAGALRLYAVKAPTEELTATAAFSAGAERKGASDTRLPWELEAATPDKLGGVIPGEDFIVDGAGRLSLNTERVLTPEDITPAETVKEDAGQILTGGA